MLTVRLQRLVTPVMAFILLCASIPPPAVGQSDWPAIVVEDFDADPGKWRMTGGQWERKAGALICRASEGNRNAFAFPLQAPTRREVRIEADVRLDQRLVDKGWNFGGITWFQDPSNFWLLGLTEGPDGKRYVDFLESCGGTWQAQVNPATRLEKVEAGGEGLSWQPGVTYRLKLAATNERIRGTVVDLASGREYDSGAFAFGSGRAVRHGIPGFIARGSLMTVDNLVVRSPSTAGPPPFALNTGKRGNVAILGDHLPGADPDLVKEVSDALRAAGFGVTVLSATQVCDERILSAAYFFLYVIPNCRTYPAAGIEALASFARERGHVVFLGGPLMDDPAWPMDGKWLDRKNILELKRRVLPRHRPFGGPIPDPAGWTRACNDRRIEGSWEVVPEGPEGNNCLRFWTANYTGWDGYLSPSIPEIFGQGHDLLTFRAKGGPRTTQIAVEIQEEDGSRWFAVTGIGTEWGRVALSADEFRYWADSPTRSKRGGQGDALHPDKARRINFSIATSHTGALRPGEHTFWIADIGTAPNPIAGLPLVDAGFPGSLETILPRYKVYALTEETTLRPAAGRHVLPDFPATTADNLICAIPRTMGRGFGRGQKWRYIPLVEAVDGNGRKRGAPAWLLLNRYPPYSGSVFACFGLNSAEALRAAGIPRQVAKLAERLGEGVFLGEAGAEHFAYWPGETIRLGALAMNIAPRGQTVSVRMTVRDARGTLRFANTSELQVPAKQETQWQGKLELRSPQPAVYTVATELLLNGTVVDAIEHEFAVLHTRRPEKREFVTVRGNDFYLNGKKWYPVGINYWPLYVSGMDRDDYWAGWIKREFYEPQLVEEDLSRMDELGINMVSIQSNHPMFYRNLLDFIRRCGRHRIKVNLFCGLASPLAFKETELRAFIEQARLADNPALMAYDTIWEPGNYVFRGDRRKQWDRDWRKWVRNQYGSVEAAEKDWRMRGRRNEAGKLIAPPDTYFRQDGPWRVMMAAYRRFMDDLTSRKWNRANRRLREIDPNHLVSFRQGNTLPHDFTFTGTPKHIDFICPEGYSIPAGEDGYNAAGFITRYVHFTTGGKPIVWSEFGKSIWDRQAMEPSPGLLQPVAEYHELFYRMALESGANGTVPWWWPGGYRVGERSDYGIINPDGTPRPAALLAKNYGPKLKADREWPAPTVWLNMDRDAHAGGYWYVAFNTGRDAYRAAVENGKNLGIRTAGTGTTSVDTPPLAVGNRPCTGRNPPKYLNGEFNWLLIRNASGEWIEAMDGTAIPVAAGAEVRMRISAGNTQEATWLTPAQAGNRPGGVVLRTTDDSGLSGRWALPADTPRLRDVDFGPLVLTAGVTRPTRVGLRLAAVGRTAFGEKRMFTLVPTKP